MNAIKNTWLVVKVVMILTMLGAVGHLAYQWTVMNYHTSEYVLWVVGQETPAGEFMLSVLVLCALSAPALGFLLLLSLVMHEWKNPSDPKGLRDKAEALLNEAAAIERYQAQRAQERLNSVRNIQPLPPRRDPR